MPLSHQLSSSSPGCSRVPPACSDLLQPQLLQTCGSGWRRWQEEEEGSHCGQLWFLQVPEEVLVSYCETKSLAVLYKHVVCIIALCSPPLLGDPSQDEGNTSMCLQLYISFTSSSHLPCHYFYKQTLFS